MIDAEFEIFSEIAQRVRMDFPGLYMTGEYVKAPSQFPCVSIIEIDNATYRNGLTNEGEDEYAAVTYEVNVFSNLVGDKKQECKNIFSAIDREFHLKNFVRMMAEPVQNQNDATIYRMVGRYRAVIGKDHKIYRR